MKNVEFTVDTKKKTLTIVVKLDERHGPSKSGKTLVVATTEGNQKVGAGDIQFGLNVFTKEGVKTA